MSETGAPEVRALFWAMRVTGATAPFDTAHLKVFYPAGTPDRLSGIAPADVTGAPYPVVVICPGINVGIESYQWLAERLARERFVVAAYSWVGELFPGQHGITPGVDLTRLSPDTWRSGPTSPALAPVLNALAQLNEDGPLRGALDLDRVVLGGHSAGGTIALQNASRRWFPPVVAGFSYAAHAGLATALGWPPASIGTPAASADEQVPFLLMAGTNDGVINGSTARYEVESWDPVRRTFDEALGAGSTYVLFDGANHFAMGHPEDRTAARGFLDDEPTTPPEKTREALADVVTLFCRAHTRDDAEPLSRWLAHPPAAVAEVSSR